uniref:DIRAS family GTPase 3 n=2 Tax=Pipistrellus kuhlii TaxID=59472 RepID=A0A7J8A6S6_PIPKU|nr:DIRAS family GTPase 3 [Pipistrellus kuhlii]
MGNSCSGLKEKLGQRVRPSPTLSFLRSVLFPKKKKDFCVVVLGSAGVGKSALVQRWVNSCFSEKYEPPAPLSDVIYHVPDGLFGSGTKMRITDLPGGQLYPALQCLKIARGHAFILVYSVTEKQTLEELTPFYMLIREIKGSNLHKYPVVLVGNKCDEARRELTTLDGAAYALKWNCGFFETSAKRNINVEELFFELLTHERGAETSPQATPEKSQMPDAAAEDRLAAATQETSRCYIVGIAGGGK